MNLPSESVDPSRRIHRRTAIVGPSLIVVCLLHCAFAFMSGATVWQAALADGWVGAFTGIERQAVLWFLVTGLVGVVAGIAISVVERRQRLPWVVTVPLTLVAVFGVTAAPASGFWLVLAVAALGLVRSTLPFRGGDEPR